MGPGIRLFSLLLLLITYGVSPAYQVLHLKFADHAHTFCFVHDQIENVYPGQVDPPGPCRARDGQDRDRFLIGGPGSPFQGNPHQACNTLNQILDKKCLSGEPQSFAMGPVPASPLSTGPVFSCSPSCPLILISPKHSPPSALA